MQKIFLQSTVKKLDSGLYRIIASTAAIDRQGDSIDQSGWDVTNFKANPVLLWAHDYAELPIGKVVNLGIEDGNLVADFEFAPEEANPKAAQIKKLYDGGYVNASSVGLIAKERNGHVITKAELLELSLVPVPANQQALRMAMANKSVDLSLIKSDFKGEVSDAMDQQEAWEMKWQNWQKISDVMGALWNVYFAEDTEVAEFNKLLNESISLLKEVAGDDVSEDIRLAISPEFTEKFMIAVAEKSGRRLSKKTVDKIDSSLASLKESISNLESLKEEGDQVDSNSEEIAEEEKKSEDTVTISLVDFMKSFQGHLRTADKSMEIANETLNLFLKNKKL